MGDSNCPINDFRYFLPPVPRPVILVSDTAVAAAELLRGRQTIPNELIIIAH